MADFHFDMNDNVAPAPEFSLNIGMAFAQAGHNADDDAILDAPIGPSTALAFPPILSGPCLNLDDTSDAFPAIAGPGFNMNLREDTDTLPAILGLGATLHRGAATLIEDDDSSNNSFVMDLRHESPHGVFASSMAKQGTGCLAWQNDISPVPDSYNNDLFVVDIYTSFSALRGSRLQDPPGAEDVEAAPWWAESRELL